MTASTRTVAALDEYRDTWVSAQDEACSATRIRGERSADLLDQSTRCLALAHRSLGSLIEVLVVATPAVVGEAESLVAALPRPAACIDLEALGQSSSGAQPANPELARLLDRARILARTRQGQEAATILSEVIARSQELHDVGREAEALLLLGRTRSRLLRAPESAQEALHVAYDRAKVAKRDDLVWEIWSELAQVAGHELDDPAGARIYFEHARTVHGMSGDPDADTILLGLESLLLAGEGRHDEAVRLRREVVERTRARLKPEHIEVLRARDELATALAVAGDAEAARSQHHALWTETSALLGADHPFVAHVEMNLGLDDFDLEDHEAARRRLTHARAALAVTHGASNPWLATADLRLAQIEGAAGTYVQAIARARTALAIFSEHFPRAHHDRVTALEVLSGLFLATDRFAEQLEVSLELLAVGDSSEGHVEIDLAGVLTNVGESLCDLKRCGEALPYFNRLMLLYEREPPDEPALRAFPSFGVARVHMAAGDYAAALPFLERAFEILQAHPLDRPGSRENLADVTRTLAEALAGLHRTPQRVRTLRRLVAEINVRPVGPGAASPPT